MKLKIKTGLLLSLISWAGIQAQEKKDLNEPYQVRKLKVNLILLTMDAIRFGAGLQINYQPLKRIGLEAQYRNSLYWDITKPNLSDPLNKIQSNVPGRNFNVLELGGEYSLADFLVNKKYKDIQKTERLSSATTRIHYTIEYAQARRIYAVRAFLMNVGGSTNVDSASHQYTNFTTQALSLGFARKRIDKFRAYQKHEGTRELFADLLLGHTELAAVTEAKGGVFAPNIPKDGTFTNVGWRLGFQRYGEGMYIRWELGERPEYLVKNGKPDFHFNYFMFTFGVRVFGKEKWNP